jgi:hypothetical protein
MIIILSPTAQLAADTLRLSNPPTLSVEAEYGAFVLEGTKYTAAHHQPIGSKYAGRHVISNGRSAPCNDSNIPKLNDDEVALVSHLDLDTLGGLMRATGSFVDNSTFWDYAEYIDTHGVHKADKNHPYYTILFGIVAWINEHHPKIDHNKNNDVTDFCYQAFDFIKSALEDGHLATRMGSAFIYLQDKLDESSFVEEKPCGLIVRKTKDERTNHLYRDGIAVISYNEARRNITISTADLIPNLSCRRLVQEWWGDRAGGHDQIAGSARGQIMSEDQFREAIDRFDFELTKRLN